MKDHAVAAGRVLLLATLLALLPAISTLANQTQISNYDTALRLFCLDPADNETFLFPWSVDITTQAEAIFNRSMSIRWLQGSCLSERGNMGVFQ